MRKSLGGWSALMNVPKRIGLRPNLRAVAKNATWMYLERALRMAVSFSVGIWVARYLGPKGYGTLNYAIAFVGLFADLAGLGLESIVIRELVHKPENDGRIVGTVVALRLLCGVAAMGSCFAAIAWTTRAGDPARPVVYVTSLMLLLQAFDALDWVYQARLQSQKPFLAKIPSIALAASARVAFILMGAGVIAFAWAGVAETLLAAAGVIVALRAARYLKGGLKVDAALGVKLVAESWPLAFAGLAVIVYMKIDQVMLKMMLGEDAVGIYSVAAKLSELWYFVPVALVASSYPVVIEARGQSEPVYYEKLQKLMDAVALVAWGFVVFIALSSRPIVAILFGRDYAAAAPILCLHIWGGIFVAQGLVFGRWLTLEGHARYFMGMTIIGAVVNVALNLLWIPRYQGSGAAAATVVSYACMGSLATLVLPKSRRLFWMQCKAVLLPRPLRLLAAHIKTGGSNAG